MRLWWVEDQEAARMLLLVSCSHDGRVEVEDLK